MHTKIQKIAKKENNNRKHRKRYRQKNRALKKVPEQFKIKLKKNTEQSGKRAQKQRKGKTQEGRGEKKKENALLPLNLPQIAFRVQL